MKKLISLATLGIVAVAALAYYSGSLGALFSSNYIPHRYCYLVNPRLVWTNVLTDSLIALSYCVIFGCLIWIAARLQKVASFRSYIWIFVSFAVFIMVCGATHFMEVVTIWLPVYPLSAAVKVLCAAASIPTAILFARATPALERNVSRFLEMLSATEQERDHALIALDAAEKLAAERQRAKKELADSHDLLTAVMDSTSEGIIHVSRDWTVLYGNRKCRDTLVDFEVGKILWDCFSALKSTPAEDNFRIAMELRQETEFDHFYGPYAQWYRNRAFPTETGISIFFDNITTQKELEEQLEREQILREKRIEALSHMAGGLAHEISNPLAIIHAKASGLLASSVDQETLPGPIVHAVCDKIIRTSDRAIRILRGLRGFAREASNDPMELAPVSEIVAQCLELQDDRFARHHVGLTVEIRPDTPYILCRETQVGQIVTNLLNNAFDAIVQANSTERWITLTAQPSGTNILIEVTDSGPGIESKHRAHLMEPFFTTKELGLGMGVGLSLSRAIAQDHGGTLTLSDDTTHTCFRLLLPVKPAAEDNDIVTATIGVFA